MFTRLTSLQLIKVRRLLEVQWRFVEIARELELSVWTIAKIANEPDLHADPVPEDQLPVDDAPPDYVAADLRRCPGCGGMVYHWPCIACRDMNSPPVEPAPEVVDELVDRVGWDVMEQRSGRKGEGERGRWGQRPRRTKGNAAYRAKMARRGVQEHRS